MKRSGTRFRRRRGIKAVYGYARVSTTDQNLTIQKEALRAASCDVIHIEKINGTTRNGRAELKTLIQFLRPGDTLMVMGVDHLAQSIADLQDIVRELKAKAEGVYTGRNPSIITTELIALKAEGVGATEIANKRLGIGRASVYRILGADA